MAEPSSQTRVAYLVSQYPAPSHVFIEREILGLRALGAEVATYSVRSIPQESLLSQVMRSEAARTRVLLDSKRNVAIASARLARRHPVALGRAVGRAARSGEPLLRSRTWQMFYLAEAVRLHAEMSSAGLRHLHVHFSNNAADIARLVVALGQAIDGPEAGWTWTMTVHGPTEFEAVDRVDLAAKAMSARAVACISDFTRSQLMRLMPPDQWEKLHIVRMSVDTDAYGPPPGGRRHDGPLRILSVGRLVPEKGAPILLDAVRELVDSGIDVELRLVGAGPLQAELESRVERAGLSLKINIMGAIGQEFLPELYHWADVFCLPSFQEGLPVVLMEAMASGLPVVTTRIAGIPELVRDGSNGFVVTPGRADLVAAAIRDLAHDPAKREQYGSTGRVDVATAFSSTETARAQLDFLESV